MNAYRSKGRFVVLCVVCCLATARSTVSAEDFRHQLSFPDDDLKSWTSPAFVKFTLMIDPGSDPNVVFFQNSSKYAYHYDFAVTHLSAFSRKSQAQMDAMTLYAEGQQAVLGTVILPPPYQGIQEVGLQLSRYDPYTREQALHWLKVVSAAIEAESPLQVFYFPTFEQYPGAQQDRRWFAEQGFPLSSTARWVQGDAAYAEGWALGCLKWIPANEIQSAYVAGDLTGEDILLTDAMPAEIPLVAGMITLNPSTPNSHMAILARSKAVPFVHLAVAQEVAAAQALVGRPVYLAVGTGSGFGAASTTVKLLDMTDLDPTHRQSLLDMKLPQGLAIDPMARDGLRFSADTADLFPWNIDEFGGKVSHFGILRRAIPDHSPEAVGLSFALWQALLDQPVTPVEPRVIGPGEHLLLWADDDAEQGLQHLAFRLRRSGEAIGLYDRDGVTMLDHVTFGPQATDVSYVRTGSGTDQWEACTAPTPGQANAAPVPVSGLVINEFMADNAHTLADPCEAGEFADWIELYNGSDEPIELNGLFLTDDLDEPTQWQIPPVVGAGTLGEEIERRLGAYTHYPPADLKALSADLAAIRNLFVHPDIVSFPATVTAQVLGTLESFGFDAQAKIRFRSSTNVEDSDSFTGAGLYDSASGCLADDLDDDQTGPCACDDASSEERGVFRALRRVLASFYNDNAFIERLKHGIDEQDVGMAVLVHHSFPDEIELANGVATIQHNNRGEWEVHAVCQKGAVSVTNPPMDVTPEEVRIENGWGGISAWLETRSSLLSMREDAVMAWEADYVKLYDLLTTAAQAYCDTTGHKDPVLDCEFKKLGPNGKLIVKQLRPLPQVDSGPYDTPFLHGQAQQYCIVQGRGSDVFENHRLKSCWTIRPKGLWFSSENLQQCPYQLVDIEYAAEGRIRHLSGDMTTWPEFAHQFVEPQTPYEPTLVLDQWSLQDLTNARRVTLTLQPMFGGELADPVVTPADMRFRFQVEYEDAVTTKTGQPTHIEEAALYTPWQGQPDELFNEVYTDANGLSITTHYHVRWALWGSSAPTSVQMRDTVIEGLTSQPIVLTGHFSQSVGGGPHLCPLEFLFEPQLEPDIAPEILEELQALGIRQIFFSTGDKLCRPTEVGDTDPYVRFYGFDQ